MVRREEGRLWDWEPGGIGTGGVYPLWDGTGHAYGKGLFIADRRMHKNLPAAGWTLYVWGSAGKRGGKFT